MGIQYIKHDFKKPKRFKASNIVLCNGNTTTTLCKVSELIYGEGNLWHCTKKILIPCFSGSSAVAVHVGSYSFNVIIGGANLSNVDISEMILSFILNKFTSVSSAMEDDIKIQNGINNNGFYVHVIDLGV